MTLKCDEAYIYPIGYLVHKKPFCARVDEAQLYESGTQSPNYNHPNSFKKVCTHIPLLGDHLEETIKETQVG